MGKIAFVFAGQGAQCPGMGRALAEEVPVARTVFDRVDSIRPGTSAQCFGGTEEELKNTANTQPCLFAVELAAAAALEERGIRADMAAGFSLGELAALTYSRAADLGTGFRLVCRRGELMAGDARDNPSAMAAVLKLTDRQVEEVCGGFSEAWPVNYNCPGQVTVACRKETLKPLSAAVKEAGGRALPLRVQGGFHSPFMARAAHAFAEVLAEALLTDPEIPLYSNCSGAPYAGDIRDLLARQIESPVRWEAIVRNMIAEGADTFIELGPGRTLCGLIEKIDQSVRVFSMESPEDLHKIVGGVLGC